MVLVGHVEHAKLAEFKDEDESQVEYAYFFADMIAIIMIISVVFMLIVLDFIWFYNLKQISKLVNTYFQKTLIQQSATLFF